MQQINEERLVDIVVDFDEIRKEQSQLNEYFNYMFGSWISTLLRGMFGEIEIPVTIRGTKKELAAFANVLGKEKRYIEAYKKFGLDSPRTYKNKKTLDLAIASFEKTTGITWPFR